MAVADVFQALAQRRPYRQPLSPQGVQEYLDAFARERHLDPQLVELVADNLDACWEQATCNTRDKQA